MKYFTFILALIMMFTFSFNLYAADEKNIEKKIVVKTTDKKTGLGVVVSTVYKEADQSPDQKGARIIEVFKGSEADEIGLKKGDLIVKLNDKDVTKPSDLIEMMDKTEEGEEISLVVIRDGKEKSFKATLKPFSGHGYAFHSEDAEDYFFQAFKAPHPDGHTKILRMNEGMALQKKGGYLGVQVKDLSDQLHEYFEVENGVLIEEVMKDSPAGKAGLKAGDVITNINDRRIEDSEDLVRTINYFNPDEKVNVHFYRKGSQRDVTAVLGKKPAFSWVPPRPGKRGELEWISENGENEVVISEDEGIKTIKIKNTADADLTEVNEEFLIF